MNGEKGDVVCAFEEDGRGRIGTDNLVMKDVEKDESNETFKLMESTQISFYLWMLFFTLFTLSEANLQNNNYNLNSLVYSSMKTFKIDTGCFLFIQNQMRGEM